MESEKSRIDEIINILNLIEKTIIKANSTIENLKSENKQLKKELEDVLLLVTSWANADIAEGFHQEPECDCGAQLCTASAKLRRLVAK